MKISRELSTIASKLPKLKKKNQIIYIIRQKDQETWNNSLQSIFLQTKQIKKCNKNKKIKKHKEITFQTSQAQQNK